MQDHASLGRWPCNRIFRLFLWIIPTSSTKPSSTVLVASISTSIAAMIPLFFVLCMIHVVYATGQDTILRDGDLRLFGGKTPREGRLEVRHMGFWGTVCDDYWNRDEEGLVACRQLGFTGYGTFEGSRDGLSHDLPILMDDVFCDGTEERLVDCEHRDFYINDCSHFEDVFAACTGHYDTIRLVGSRYPNEGRVEVFQNGKWGTICDLTSRWGIESAGVVCRQLGYRRALGSAASYAFEQYSDAIVLSNVRCTGYENSLLDCAYSNDTFGCSHSFDVAVVCDTDTSPIDNEHESFSTWNIVEVTLISFFALCSVILAWALIVLRIKTVRRRNILAHISGSTGFENPNYPFSSPSDLSMFHPTGYPATPPPYDHSTRDADSANVSETVVNQATQSRQTSASYEDVSPIQYNGIPSTQLSRARNGSCDSDKDDEQQGDYYVRLRNCENDDMPPPYHAPTTQITDNMH